MSQTIIRVEHSTLGALGFTQDEAVSMRSREVQPTFEQVSQTGNITVLYSGQPHFEFDIVFEVFYRSTLEKLSQIWNLQEEFTVYPFILEAPLSSFRCLWPLGTFLEQFRFGLPVAQWDVDVTWKEATTGTCPEILRS